MMDVYQSLSQEFSAYQSSQSLNCVEKCGACCNNPDIEVSPLEMLPLALHLFDTGRAEHEFDELDNYGFACKQYQRLSLTVKKAIAEFTNTDLAFAVFGAAGYKTKSGEATLSVCKPIKQAVPEKYAAALIAIQPAWGQSNNSDPMSISNSKPPMIAEGRQKLAQLDYELGDKLIPINDALRYILEKILTLSFYSQNINDGVAA